MSAFELHIYRPITNFGDQDHAPIKEMMAELGIKPTRFQYRYAGRISILGFDEINSFFRNANIGIDEVNKDDFIDYLDRHLPDSTNYGLKIDTFPITQHSLRSNSRRHRRLFCLGPEDPTIEAERAMAKRLTEEYFGLDDTDTQHIWDSATYQGRMRLLRSDSQRETEACHTIMFEDRLFPDVLLLDSVVIDEVIEKLPSATQM
jgi:hypothetical protein